VELLWDMIMPFQIPFVTKSVLLGGSNYQENKIGKKKTEKKKLSATDRETGTISLAFKFFSVHCQAFKHLLTIHKTSEGHYSHVYVTQCNLIDLPTFLQAEQEWNRLFT